MNLVYVYADSPQAWDASEWRCAVPARAINGTQRHQAGLVSMDEFANNTLNARQACQQADVLLVQRNLVGPVLAAIQHWKAQGKAVIADFDDAYNLIPPYHPAHAYWVCGVQPLADGTTQKVDPPPLTQLKWGLRLVHGATASSKRLAADWESYTPVAYLPSYIDLERYLGAWSSPHDGVVIGWRGSLAALRTFTESGVLEALKNVCRARRQVKVMISSSDGRILDRLPIPARQKIFQPWGSPADWPHTLAQFDIGIAPCHGPYEARQSWARVLEYLVMKIPWVASQGPAYHELRAFGWLVENQAGAWERVLLDMVDHLLDYRAEAACEPYLYGIAHAAQENTNRLIDCYQAIAGRAPA
jgi:hypothetical protein